MDTTYDHRHRHKGAATMMIYLYVVAALWLGGLLGIEVAFADKPVWPAIRASYRTARLAWLVGIGGVVAIHVAALYWNNAAAGSVLFLTVLTATIASGWKAEMRDMTTGGQR